jgi:CheY-like chemotaxis protein
MVKALNILLVDDDKDDRLLFEIALEEIPLSTSLTTFKDGEQLMLHLENVSTYLPDVLFLDLNMPRKTGFEYLHEIKNHPLLKRIPVIIFSTSYDEDKALQLYESGAHYYICKPADFNDFKMVVQNALMLIQQDNIKPTQQNFLITAHKTVWD